MRDPLLFWFCFFTLALFRTPFVYCRVYIHPQAFYKNLLYCILLSYMCYLLRAFFTMITHCVSICTFLKLFGAKRNNTDSDFARQCSQNNLCRLLRVYHTKRTPGKHLSPMLALSLDSQGFRKHETNPAQEAKRCDVVPLTL